MTEELLVAGAIATAVAIVALIIRRATRHWHAGRRVELGAVSTRWLAELRRDEPWPHS